MPSIGMENAESEYVPIHRRLRSENLKWTYALLVLYGELYSKFTELSLENSFATTTIHFSLWYNSFFNFLFFLTFCELRIKCKKTLVLLHYLALLC